MKPDRQCPGCRKATVAADRLLCPGCWSVLMQSTRTRVTFLWRNFKSHGGNWSAYRKVAVIAVAEARAIRGPQPRQLELL